MPCSRHSSGTGTPASACFRTARIWLSVKRDFFMQNLLRIAYEKILLLSNATSRGDYPWNGCSQWPFAKKRQGWVLLHKQAQIHPGQCQSVHGLALVLP